MDAEDRPIPAMIYGKSLALKIMAPFLQSVQSWSAYQYFARRLWVPKIFPSPTDFQPQRLDALVHGRYAGCLEFSVYDLEARKAAWISNLHVRIRYRGAGIAGRLFQALDQEAKKKGIQEYYLTFRNHGWIPKFYRKLGFQEIGQEEKYFWMNENKITTNTSVFKKILRNSSQP